MKNKRQILTIRNAVDSYMKIVSNQVKDLVPKCVVKILLNSCKDFIQSDLLSELYNNNLANLILENVEEVNQREEKRRLYGACRDTLKVFDDIYITLFNTLFKTVNNAYKDVTTNTTTTPTTTNPATMK
ncbi:dynamin-like [Artemia franciscana]|uniref:dynamin-like n=1 Tax=Artemia franciscana TaxID=6661 RepID=UPI0032DAA17D